MLAKIHFERFIAVFFLTALLSACGGGGSSGTSSDNGDTVDNNVEGLELPTQMSVVTAADTDEDASAKSVNPAGIKTQLRALSSVFDAVGTDYSTDPQRAHVYDRSLEPLSMVNEILCYIDQTAADEMVNQGAYTALINGTKCHTGQEASSESGQSSGQAQEYESWTVVSTRASDTAPQITRFWFDMEEHDANITVMGEITVTEGVSEQNPFGKFTLNFKGSAEFEGNTVELMRGTLKTKNNVSLTPEFVLFMQEGQLNLTGERKVRAADVRLDDADGNSGQAVISTVQEIDCSKHGDWGDCQDSGETGVITHQESYSVAFNTNYLLNGADDGSGVFNDQQCRARNEFSTHVWRYNLYDKLTGDRVQMESGFPIRFSAGGIMHNGFASYWGLWTDHIDPSNITEVTRNTHGNGQGETYDVFHAPGKLIKSVRSTLALDNLDGETFEYWDNDDHQSYLVEYTNDTALSTGAVAIEAGFYKTHQVSHTPGSGNNSTPLDEAEKLDSPWLNLWSQSLGGRVSYTQSDANNLTLFRETPVTPDDTDAFAAGDTVTLYCYNQCLKSGITQNQIDYQSGNTPYLNQSNSVNTPAATYTFNKNDLTLKLNNVAVTLNEGVEPGNNSPHHWGIQTGAMVSDNSALSNPWDTWNQSISYRWETGVNAWNQLTALQHPGTGAFVHFDRPMRFNYTHTSAQERDLADDEISAHEGRPFMLEYGGQGNLWGIPSESNEEHRYYPLFSLKDGTTLSDGNHDYVVKAIDMEQSMLEKDVSLCTGDPNQLSLDNIDLTLPDETSLSTVTINADDQPTVTDTPAVVEGVVVMELQDE